MELITPEIGLVFWTTLAFSILFIVLRKYAWRPVLDLVNERELEIEKALSSADAARKEMELLTADNQRILREARHKKETLLKEARQIREKMIDKAKTEAKTEAQKMISQARQAIQNEKMAAITDLKNQVGELSIGIAEKLLQKELNQKGRQQELVNHLLKDLKIN